MGAGGWAFPRTAGFLTKSSGVHARTHAVGHMSVDIEPDSEWRKVIAAVRAVHPKVPIVVFGGHHHVRFLFQPRLSLFFFLPPSFTPKSGCASSYSFRLWAMETETDGNRLLLLLLLSSALLLQVRQCARYDDYSMGLAGGRYMETIGFMSESSRVGLGVPSPLSRQDARPDLKITWCVAVRCGNRSFGTERDGGSSAHV